MRVFEAVLLGILQGLTEFLPVSSSGHLVIGQKLLGLAQALVLFDILVHLGTLLAIVFYFNKRMIKFYLKPRNLGLVVLGSLPVILVGFWINDFLEHIFNSLAGVGFSLLLTAGLLFSIRLIKGVKRRRGLGKMKSVDALIIGCLQTLALLPGVSRSGSTVVGGLWRKLKRESAFSFSFYLGAPAMIGAVLLQVPEMIGNGKEMVGGIIGMVTAFIFGLISLRLLEKVVLKGKLFYFGVYCLVLGGAILLTSI